MQVNEQAVEAAARALADAGVPHDVQSALIHGTRWGIGVAPGAMIKALTAAAPHMSGSAREQALEEAAQIAELHEGEPCRPAIAWTDEERQFYASGQQDASSSIATAIRALKSQPAH
ncbi:hypothetical protein ACFOLL_12835 [Falsochrobactrum ovis]|uniref:Uncharacterized protein n=1 Tax=Falsochrobactrum ovis TaxID=1293442 RepID=A0A364JSM3_9HYPH|nr:hypothetical protein [Falsochrobactrum ovis]RAK26325.1 hypothetical protein C7374_11410 [Falsochrobactrum ovis]